MDYLEQMKHVCSYFEKVVNRHDFEECEKLTALQLNIKELEKQKEHELRLRNRLTSEQSYWSRVAQHLWGESYRRAERNQGKCACEHCVKRFGN